MDSRPLRDDLIELEGNKPEEAAIEIPEDIMEDDHDFLTMEEFWKNKGYRTHDEFKKHGNPVWFTDFCAQIDDDMSGSFDVEETMVGIFWLLSLVPKGGSREDRKKNGGTTSDKNLMQTLLALKAKFRLDFEEEQDDYQKMGKSRGKRKTPDAQRGAEPHVSEDPKAAEEKEHKIEIAPTDDAADDSPTPLKSDYKLFGMHLQLAIQIAVHRRVTAQSERREARQKMRTSKKKKKDEKSPLIKGLKGDAKARAKIRIRHITRCVQDILREWKKAHIPSTSEKFKGIGKNAGIACIIPFKSTYENWKEWREDVVDCPEGNNREKCKIYGLWLPLLILKGLLFTTYYYAMIFNVIYYQALIYPFINAVSEETGEELVNISFMEAWMPLVFVVLVDFLFVHGQSYSHAAEEEGKFSDYQRRMAMVNVHPFDKRQAPSTISIMSICERLESTFKKESEHLIDLPMLSLWKKAVAVLLAFTYACLPIVWRWSDGGPGLASWEVDDGEVFGRVRHRYPEAPVAIFNFLISFPALTLLLLELFVMNVDFLNQLKQFQALTAFTSSKTARKYEHCEDAFDNTYMELGGIVNIQGFMVAREVIREDGIPEGSQRVVPPIILLTVAYSLALIVKVVLFAERGVTAFMVTATYLVAVFLLFLIFAILTVARSNTLLKDEHLELLLETSKKFDQQMKDEIDRVRTARQLKQRREAVERREIVEAGREHERGKGEQTKMKKEFLSTEFDDLKKESLAADRSSLETAIMEIQSLNEPIRFVGIEVDMALLFQVVAMAGAAAVSSALQFLGFGG